MIRQLALALLLAVAGVSVAGPSVFWASDPVRPGEAVMVVGDALGDQPKVSMARFGDGDPGTPVDPRKVPLAVGAGPVQALQVAAGSLKFVVPKELYAGLYFFDIRTQGDSTWGLLNRPEVWWAQGDLGRAGSPGGWLRIFGKNLANTGKLPITVELQGPRRLRLKASGDEFALRVALPADTAEGEYKLFTHNGWGERMGWSEPIAITVRKPGAAPAKRLNVLDFGADGRGEADDTEAIGAGVAALKQAGGGTLFFPRGRYRVTDTLELPPQVTLQGEGRELTCIFWPDVQDPLPAQIKGTDHFTLEDLTFYASNYSRFVVADGGPTSGGSVRLRRVTVRADRYRGHPTEEEVARRLKAGGGNQCPLLSFGGPDVEITDCDLYSSGMVFWLSGLRGATIAGNTLTNGRWGWYSLSGSDGVVFENNRIIGGDLMATGGGLNCLDGSNFSQHVYYAHNSLTTMFGWDREAMTSDAGGGAYYGKVAGVKDCTVTVAEDIKDQGHDWKGGGLYILDGRGAGQYRRVVSARGREIVVDRPWQVPPDGTSTVTCCAFQGRCLFLDNDFTDAGIALQFYGNAMEHICAGNRSTRTAGFHNFGMIYSDGIQPNWYLQWLDNEIIEGNVYRGDHDNSREAGEAHIGVYAFPPRPDWDVPLTLGTVIRRNRLDSNAHIMLGCEWSGGGFERAGRYVRDVLVEGNTIKNADLGVFAYATAEGVVVRGNSYEGVKRPLGGPGLARAFVTSAEQEAGLRASLQSLVSDLGLKVQVTRWPEVRTALATIRQLPDGSAEVEALRTRALRAALGHVAEQRPQGLPLSALAQTLGLSVRMPWETPAHVDLQNRPAGGPSALDLILTETTPLGEPLTVTAEVTPPEGWTSRPSAPVELSPKAPAKLNIPLVIPPGAWSAYDLAVTLSLAVGDTPLKLTTIITAGSGYLRKWMLLGPLPNRSGQALDITLLPPDDGLDLDGEYDGASGKIKWQPWEDGDWLRFNDLYPKEKSLVAYAVGCVNSPRAMPAEVQVGGAASFALTVNGEPVASVARSSAAGPGSDRVPISLRQGDNVLTFKLTSAAVDWAFVCNLTPAKGGPPLKGVTVISPAQFRGRACFAPPKKRAPVETGPLQHTAGVDWKLVWADDFDRPALGARWRVGGGKWAIHGPFVQGSDVAFLCYAEAIPAPVRIEYDARAAGTTPGDLSACWLAKPDEYNSGYLFGFGSNGNTLDKLLVNGEQVVTAPGPLVKPGKWHHVIAQVLATGRAQLIVDDQLAFDYQGKTPGAPLFPGLWAWNSEGAFARVRIFRGP